MQNDELVPLTSVARELFDLTGRQPPTYRELWQAVVDGRLQAERVNGRHFLRRKNLPNAARSLGMTPEATT